MVLVQEIVSTWIITCLGQQKKKTDNKVKVVLFVSMDRLLENFVVGKLSDSCFVKILHTHKKSPARFNLGLQVSSVSSCYSIDVVIWVCVSESHLVLSHTMDNNFLTIFWKTSIHVLTHNVVTINIHILLWPQPSCLWFLKALREIVFYV